MSFITESLRKIELRLRYSFLFLFFFFLFSFFFPVSFHLSLPLFFPALWESLDSLDWPGIRWLPLNL